MRVPYTESELKQRGWAHWERIQSALRAAAIELTNKEKERPLDAFERAVLSEVSVVLNKIFVVVGL